jgi:dihydroorotate dehydrogenase (NAD+) catalytic subunit
MFTCAITLGMGRKKELVLTSPVLIASGALGFEQFNLETPSQVGAIVTPPLTWRPRAEAVRPRFVRTAAGFLLHTGRRNPGLRAALRRYGRMWEHAGIPVIVALYARTSAEFAEMAAFLTALEWVQGLELHLPHDMEPDEARESVAAVVAEAGLPCLVRVPFEQAVSLATVSAEAGADGLVVASPPVGRWPDESGGWVYGPLHSPALAPLYVELVHRVAGVTLLPIIGRGGIAALQDALALIAAGAVAVQLDSILMVHPAACGQLYLALERELAERQLATWDEYLAALRRAEG